VLATKKDAVLIPAVAQQIGQQGPFVYVTKQGVGPDGKPATLAELRPISPGQRQGDMIVVDRGLQAGEAVVVTGHMMVMPGGPVMVIPTPPPQGGPSAAQASAE
jgi:multidrug efflux pump subunit AcrA (membrane-fusion protein)